MVKREEEEEERGGKLKMLEYVIEGHDGSAKTPIVDGVKNRLERAGLVVEVCAPFQVVNNQIEEEDIYLYWQNDEMTTKALELLSNAINYARQKAKDNGADILLYDRHWLTIVGEIDHRNKFEWEDYRPTFFIEAPVEKTMDCKRFSFAIPWTSSVEVITDCYDKYLVLAEKYSEHIVQKYRVEKRTQPLGGIIDSIYDHIIREYA
jgi:predicted ATPase